MRVNIQELLDDCGVTEKIYPGKRIILKLPQSGEFKSHSVIYDWRMPETLRMEIKAGLSFRDLEPKDLKKYPVSFQAPTYIDIDTTEEEEDEESGSKGKSGGGGKGHKKKKTAAFDAFSKVVEGKIPDLGKIKEVVLMGKKIAENAISTVLESLKAQIREKCITPVNILAEANAIKVVKATPGGGLEATGNEDIKYKYKGAEMFGLGGPT